MEAQENQHEELQNLLKNYSLDDLAKSFFVLNLWLPNIASPIKIQYLYVILESIQGDLKDENQIETYSDFTDFCKKLLAVIPSFPMLEDYTPEADWGEIKYFYNEEFYKIFYGGDLSNPYDYYYAFEIMHKAFGPAYLNTLKRSPLAELEFCLNAQDHILSNLEQASIAEAKHIESGHFEIPSEGFWLNSCDYIDKYQPTREYEEIMAQYTKETDRSMAVPPMEVFMENAFRGKNCSYLFIKNGDKYYPVIPRKWLTVIYDTWGYLLKDNYAGIIKELGSKAPNILITAKLASFIQKRIDENYIFPLARSVTSELKVANDLIYIGIHAGDKMILIYVMPLLFSQKQIEEHLKAIKPKLEETAELLRQSPSRLGLLAEKKIVEFRSKKEEKALEPTFIIALPAPSTDMIGGIKIPKDIPVEIMTIDQVAGIFDEIEKTQELSDFLDYLDTEQEFGRIVPLNSHLDKFGSFRGSSGVLVPGAREPDMIVLDFNWGSNFRYKSLKDFWSLYPEENFFGEPRSWSIPKERRTSSGFVLNSKMFLGYAYYQKVGQASIFINAPVHCMELDDGMINDSIMLSLFDAIEIYSHTISKLDLTKSPNKIQVHFCPEHLVINNTDFRHLRHLTPVTDMWQMDCTRLHLHDYGIRVVYNKDNLIKALHQTADRSIQIRLLTDVLTQLSTVVAEPNLPEIEKALNKEGSKKARFKTFAVEKTVSFPEGIRTIRPEHREYKLADKEISKLAHKFDIQPGTYSAEVAQEKLNKLREEAVKILDDIILNYNFASSIPLLLEKANALINDAWRTKKEIEASLEHEVDYKRSVKAAEEKKKMLHWHRTYRYIIEKFVQLQPNGQNELDNIKLRELLAFVDRLLDIYVASDFINYQIYPVNVEIDADYIVSIKDQDHDISEMEKEYGEEQAKINLGIIGKKQDAITSSIPIEDYLNELDLAFKKDFGFSLKNLVNVQQVLALWALNAGIEENAYYSATIEQITKICSAGIKGFEASETESIIDFLTLKPSEILLIKDKLDDKGKPEIQKDLPIWEHNKRLMRLDIRPLIMIDGQYYWGPHTIERSAQIWLGISSKHRLPSNLNAPTVKAVLAKGHTDTQNNLVKMIEEVARRYTDKVKTNIYPHKLEKSDNDIGDYDVLAYLADKNILLNIESKIIAPPFCNKDAGRMQRKIFGEVKDNGVFKKGELQPVEERAAYLKKNGEELMKKLGWQPSSSPPKVVSIFVTKMGFWWTKHLPIKTEVKFIEIQLLDDFLQSL